MAGLGATLVALTPQKAEKNQIMIDKHNLKFDMLSDPNNSYAEELGLKFYIGDEVKKIYSGFGIDLEGDQGNSEWNLPIPGRFVIDQGGTIRAADVDIDYTRRPEPSKTLDDLKAL